MLTVLLEEKMSYLKLATRGQNKTGRWFSWRIEVLECLMIT